MKASAIATVFALATAVFAQFDNIPKCAVACFLGPLGSDGCTDILDFACHCKKGTELLGEVQPCTKKACSEADQKTTIEAVETTCKGVGVPIEIPDDTPASSAVVITSVVTATPSATVVTSVQSATPSSDLASSLSEAISSALSSASSVASSVASASASASASHSASHSGSHSGSASSTPTATTSEFTAGAAHATQAVGLMGAAAIALLAL
jgi:hypothetical protein